MKSTKKVRVRHMLLNGERFILQPSDNLFPQVLKKIPDAPKKLYVIGNPYALKEGLAVIGARRATPYGISCAKNFASQAAEQGIVVVSGGAYGCDSAAHRGALEVQGRTVVVLGGGCNQIYPAENADLFQEVIDKDGAIISEQPWNFPPKPYMFRKRNRIVAALGKAVLIVEAGLPSGTFSTADEALAMNKDVWVVPGAITSPMSYGSNRLILQGATPIIDSESFQDALAYLFGTLKMVCVRQLDHGLEPSGDKAFDGLLEAIRAESLSLDDLYFLIDGEEIEGDKGAWLMEHLILAEQKGFIARQADGRWGPVYA
ncbi:MAG: DNA-processing protein DprA [Eggerthellaceae bacterium]|jgi:DNA processing protein